MGMPSHFIADVSGFVVFNSESLFVEVKGVDKEMVGCLVLAQSYTNVALDDHGSAGTIIYNGPVSLFQTSSIHDTLLTTWTPCRTGRKALLAL